MNHTLTLPQPIIASILILTAQFTSNANASGANAHMPGCEQEMIVAARRHAVPVAILYAVALAETGDSGKLQPYALNVEGTSVESTSAEQARMAFDKARSEGATLIDVGCMQVNFHYHGGNFPSFEAMLVPALNVDYAARFLKALRDREGNWTAAVARYNAGPSNTEAHRRYVCRVLTNMVRSGFGAWTENARGYCQ